MSSLSDPLNANKNNAAAMAIAANELAMMKATALWHDFDRHCPMPKGEARDAAYYGRAEVKTVLGTVRDTLAAALSATEGEDGPQRDMLLALEKNWRANFERAGLESLPVAAAGQPAAKLSL